MIKHEHMTGAQAVGRAVGDAGRVRRVPYWDNPAVDTGAIQFGDDNAGLFVSGDIGLIALSQLLELAYDHLNMDEQVHPGLRDWAESFFAWIADADAARVKAAISPYTGHNATKGPGGDAA